MKKFALLLIIGGLLPPLIYAQIVTTLVPSFPGDGEISFDSEGNIYVNDSGENGNLDGKSVWKVTPEGAFDLFHDNLPVWVVGSKFHPNGNLLVTGWAAGTISSISPDGAMSSIITSNINGAGSLEIDENENIYVAEYSESRILKCDTNGGNCVTFATDEPILFPAGLAYVEETGKLYSTNWTNGKIIEIDNNGLVTLFAQLPVPNAGPIKIYGNHMIVTSPQHHVVYKIPMNSPQLIEVLAGIEDIQGNIDGPVGTATLDTPTGIGLFEPGKLYIAEMFNGTGRLRVLEDSNLGVADFTSEVFTSILYPNPAHSLINLNFSDTSITTVVSDVLGRKLVVPSELINPNLLQLNIEEFPAGTYFLKLLNTNGETIKVHSFIKK